MRTLLLGLLAIGVSTEKGMAELDFNRDIRPILAGHCFKCHGPDAAKREADLRLDDRDSALSTLNPQTPAESELLGRITSKDPDELMPPPATKNPLTEAQIATLRQWINDGAPYAPHWAFEPPSFSPLPAAQQSTLWARNEIDPFILEGLAAKGLHPQLSATPEALVRRAYFDLLGYPPTPDELDAHVADASPNAFNRLTDRLLASPSYGEHWARPWLDLARYADTNGYEKDRPRTIWPYRDWVIDAINADLPFDDFTIQQLAGDLLPDAGVAERIASGFHRNTMLNEEGGIDPQEYRFHSLVDRVGTTGTVWLGLTLSCAQCHTHKFDPILHEEYYGIMAYFNNADEPEMPVPDARIALKQAVTDAEIAKLEKALPSHLDDPEATFQAWLTAERAGVLPWEILTPLSADADVPKLSILDDRSILARGDQTKRDVYTVRFEGTFEDTTAIRLEALPDESLPKSGPGRAYYEGPKGDFFLSEIKVSVDGKPLAFASASESYGKLGIGGGSATADQAIDGDEVTGWSTSGREGEAHQAVFVLERPVASGKALEIHLVFNRHYPAGLGRFRIAAIRGSREAKARSIPVEIESKLTDPERWRDALFGYFLNVTPALAKAREPINALRASRPAFPSTLVFQERPKEYPRLTHRHHRGEFLQVKEVVRPGIPAIFGKGTSVEEQPKDRLGFARWLVSKENPLGARVAVNRAWAGIFGKGLVRTQEDFGYQGEAPTHPALLDRLAVAFERDGWSRKKLHKTLLTSATYQQNAVVTPEHWKADPENRLLGRAPRFRIRAESVRDSALRMAGLLTFKMGGPSVFPPQPANITTEGAYGQLSWKVSDGEDRYRRGLYTFAKRTAPYAAFLTFDGTSGEACVARRELTNTPLQALTLLNDEVFSEVAGFLGKHTARLEGDDASKGRQLFRRLFTRLPDEGELAMVLDFLASQRKRFSGEPDNTKALLDAGLTNADEAAWATAARVLLNTDECFLRQ